MASLRNLSIATVSAITLLALAGCSASNSSGETKTASSTASGAKQVKVQAVSQNGNEVCKLSADTVAAGAVTFEVQNVSAASISEVELISGQRIVGEKENLAPGLAPVKFTVTLDGGKYKIYCPGASQEYTDLTVTGKAKQVTGSTQSLLQQGADQYGTYVTRQISDMVTATETLDKAVRSEDLKAAQDAYAKARPFYERAESAVEGFVLPGFKADDNSGNLDYLIDMRQSNLDTKVGWTGFHAVERALFKYKKIDAEAKSYSSDLLTNVKKLNKLVPTLKFKPEDLANGAAGLLEEVQSGKVTGEEEAFSHIDLVDLAGNVEGAQQAFANLEPGLKKINPTITTQIANEFDKVNKLLSSYKDNSELGGYKRYTADLKRSDAKKISDAVQRLQAPLANLSEKVATAE